MAEFIVFLLLVALIILAAIGAIRVYEWLTETDAQHELAERERRAALEIQDIAHRAQVAMLDEAMRRTMQRSDQPRIVEGEVIRTYDAPDDQS